MRTCRRHNDTLFHFTWHVLREIWIFSSSKLLIEARTSRTEGCIGQFNCIWKRNGIAPPVSDLTKKLTSFFFSFMQMINFIFFGFVWPTMTMNHHIISQEYFFFLYDQSTCWERCRNRISARFERTTRRRKRKKKVRECTIPPVSTRIKIAINGSHNKYFAARKRRRRKNQMFAENSVYLNGVFIFVCC